MLALLLLSPNPCGSIHLGEKKKIALCCLDWLNTLFRLGKFHHLNSLIVFSVISVLLFSPTSEDYFSFLSL